MHTGGRMSEPNGHCAAGFPWLPAIAQSARSVGGFILALLLFRMNEKVAAF